MLIKRKIKIDFFFSYKNVFRFFLIQQYGLFKNTFQLPFVKKLFVFFKIYNLVDVDDVRTFNYAYLFRFFFGVRAFVTKTVSKYHLGVYYYSFLIYSFFFNKYCFFPIALCVNDFLPYSSSEDFFFSNLSVSGQVFFFWFSDLSIFIEKKTNLGFYNLKDPLGFEIFFNTYDYFSSVFLVSFLKLFVKKTYYDFLDFVVDLGIN